MSGCPHVPDLPRPEPAALGETCPECLAAGTHPVQLRLCLSCGHVGCCDSSPGRHATGHFERTGHPVMRSFEPGEKWRWCFVDGSIV
ncbi:UBP-type zinc finger domain-containing protein [Streptomyces sp. NBC_00726]|uniref:UBP-type zinc finger domain-containing protein n=1 Tax=Streptomyces sp. NBC_00726 TaxID=2903674 RepID=UPI0038641346